MTEPDIYRQGYFQQYYHQKLPDFTAQDAKRVENYFWGWFKYVDRKLKLGPGNKRRTLDIGCGLGSFSAILSRQGFDAYAADVASDVLVYGRKFYPQVKFSHFDVRRGVPLPGEFDLIFILEVLEHLVDPAQVLVFLRQKLKRGGFLVCSTPPPYRRFKKVRRHVSVQGLDRWREVFQAAGFTAARIQAARATFLPFFYRYSRKLSFACPIGVNLPYFISPIFLFAQC